MTLSPYPYRARALHGTTVVAESDACLCREPPGMPPELWFPREAVRQAVPGGGRDPVPAVTWGGDGAPAPAGYGRFAGDGVRVEVVDGDPAGDARDTSVKRWPVWGDAEHLIDLLDVWPGPDGRAVTRARTDGRRPVVEASQMLAQVVVAGGRRHPGRRVVAASMIFLRPADAARPLELALTEWQHGRAFTGLAVEVHQEGRRRAGGTLLLDATAPEVVRHAAHPPDVPGPYESVPYDMGVTGRDVRVVDGAYTGDPAAPVGPPVLDCWVRFRRVPDDAALHAGLLAQFTGHLSIAAALRPHPGVGQDQAHRTLSTAVNAISLSLHGPVRADRWLLYHHRSTFAGDGMTHSACRVHGEDGTLVASFTVDAMVRPLTGSGGDPGRAL